MKHALADHATDAEALARITPGDLRRECFSCVMDYRERGESVIAAMYPQAVKAKNLGRQRFGGNRLVGSIWNHGKGIEMSNELPCFYALPLSILHPELNDYLACEVRTAIALKKAGWKP
jgi:hypothetical protein